MSFRPKRLIYLAFDSTLSVIALLIAVFLRLGYDANAWRNADLFLAVPISVCINAAVFNQFGFYKQLWQYAGLREAFRLFMGVTTASLLLLITSSLALPGLAHQTAEAVVIIDWMVTLTLIIGSRFLPRTSKERIMPRVSLLHRKPQHNKRTSARVIKRVILVGAGEAGVMLARKMLRNPDKGYKPVAFLDDDATKKDMMIQGIRVVGSTRSIPGVIADHRADEIIMVMPSAGRQVLKRIALECKELGIDCKTVPDLVELVDGEINISQIRDIDPAELLGRKETAICLNDAGVCFKGSTVLITGAAGSIGSELCRQAISLKPGRIVATDISENGLYHLEEEINPRLSRNGGRVIGFETVIMDVRDPASISRVFTKHKPDVIFHAAAYKHVPMMERHPLEAMHNNVTGTRMLIEASLACKVKRFTLISTDKAVNPTSVMGLSKLLAEHLIKQASIGKDIWPPVTTKFMAVRFGNVLGSNGSVIPKFKRQIDNEEALTVTHPDITRYFMTVHEAVYLVIQATSMGNGGEIFVLDMGEPVKIVELARSIITLSGYEPEKDIPIKFTGLRPGEKLFEELFNKNERVDRTRHPQILEVIRNGKSDDRALNDLLGSIEMLTDRRNDGRNNEAFLDELLNTFYPTKAA